MPEEITPVSPPMEGKGSYNRYAKLPDGGAALALPLLEKAAQNLLLDRRDGPIVIADYGRHKARIFSLRWTSRSAPCGRALGKVGRSWCSMSINRRTTSTRFLKC